MSLTGNLLKLTDYPFSYSLIGLIFVISGQEFNWKELSLTSFLPLLTLIGLLATTLSITDPFGRLVRLVVKSPMGIIYAFRSQAFTRGWRWKREEQDQELKGPDQETLNQYSRVLRIRDPSLTKILINKTLSTTPVSYEIDKIISTIYFLVILIGIFIASYSAIYLQNINHLFNSTNSLQLNDKSNITYQLTNTTVTVKRDPNISTSPVIYQISNTTTITSQPPDDTTSSICNTADCERGNLVLRILLILAFMAVGYIAYLSIKKLFSRNRMMATYFYVREVVIPKMEETKDRDVSQDPQVALENQRALTQNIIKYNEELLEYIKSHDWGMAEFFEGELLRSIFRHRILN